MIGSVATPTPRAGWLHSLERAASAPASRGVERPVWSWLAAALDPSAACPRRSGEVEVHQVDSSRPSAGYVLKNARTGTYERLSPEEHFVWQHLDGRTVRQLLADYLAEYGRIAPGRVLDLIERLRAAAMLAEPPRSLYRGLAGQLVGGSWGERAERILRGVLFAEQPLPGAGDLARGVYRDGGRILFSRPALVVLALVALAGPLAYLSLLQRGGFELLTSGGSFALGFLVFALANSLASLVAESGRALATVHHGREVRAGGLRMMLATPTFYADTRDICLENRRARMAVAAAGPAALLVCGGAAALMLLLLPVGPFEDFLFKLALLCYGTTAFYLNPLVQLDGYALLAEWLEQPDLRERSFTFVRERLLEKLQARQRLDRQEQGLAVFGILAVVFAGYTAAGGVYFFGLRIVSGLSELWTHDNATVRAASMLATVAGGAALATVAALILVRALRRGYDWADRRGLLAEPRVLVAFGLGMALLIGLGALLTSGNPAVYRGLVAPPLLVIAVLYARRIARRYEGAMLRWFFNLLALYAALVFLGEEVSALHAIVQLDPAWAELIDRAVSLAGPIVCLPFGVWLSSLLTSRYRAPLGLLAAGIALYVGHGFIPDGRLASALAATGGALLAAGVLIYAALAYRRERPPTWQVGPAPDDAARLADALAVVLAQVLDEVVAQNGRLVARTLERRFNQTAEQADWGLELHDLRLVRLRRQDLLAAAPLYRQALGFVLDEAATRGGRAFVERALNRARDGLPWDRREVLDAWVLSELTWGRGVLGHARAERDDVIRFLRRVPLFAGLDDDELEGVASALRPRHVPAGRRIIRQGESGDTFYLIRSGTVEVLQREPKDRARATGEERRAWTGRRSSFLARRSPPGRTVARLGEGDAFGELALLYDQPRNATVRALSPVELLALGRADFDRLVRERFALVGKLRPSLEREALLASMPLFAELAPRELAALAERLEECDVPAGAAVVRQGEAGDSFYLVRAGQLAVTVARPLERSQGDGGGAPASTDGAGESGRVDPGLDRSDAPAQQVGLLGPGEYFGEIALLRDQPRSATVTAVTAARLFRLRKADFDRLLRPHAAAGRDLELIASRRRLDQETKTRGPATT